MIFKQINTMGSVQNKVVSSMLLVNSLSHPLICELLWYYFWESLDILSIQEIGYSKIVPKIITYKLTNLNQLYKVFIGKELSHIDGFKSGKDKRRIAKHNGRENRRYIHRVLAAVTQIHLFSKIENEKIDSVVFFSGAIEIIQSNLPNITRHDSFNIVTMDLYAGIPRNTHGRKSFTENACNL